MLSATMTHDEALKWFAELFGLPAGSVSPAGLDPGLAVGELWQFG